jgi:hypothetical protein
VKNELERRKKNLSDEKKNACTSQLTVIKSSINMTYPSGCRHIYLSLLRLYGGCTKESLELVTNLLPNGPSIQSLNRWWDEYVNYGNEEAKRVRGMNVQSSISEIAINLCRDLLHNDPTLHYDELADAVFVYTGEIYDRKQIQYHMHKIGYRSKVVETVAKERSQYLRDYWMNSVIHNIDIFPASSFVFMDEAYISCDDRQRIRGKSVEGTPAISHRFLRHQNQPGKSCLASMTIEGILSVSCNSNVDTAVFLSVLQHDVLPQMKPHPNSLQRSILVLDNASVHNKIAVINLCAEYGILVLFLPPYSPDYNPVEICHKLAKDYIKKQWGNNDCEHLTDSMLRKAYNYSITPDIACKLFEHAHMMVTEGERRWATR